MLVRFPIGRGRLLVCWSLKGDMNENMNTPGGADAAALEELARMAKAARAKVAARARLTGGEKVVGKVKEEVSPADYVRRLQQSKARDQKLLNKVERSRIDHSSEDWKRQVGRTYAAATVTDPFVMERVNRLRSGQGLHRTSLVMCGDLGVGKTWNAHAYIAEAIRSGAVTAGQVKWGTETNLLSKIAAGGYRRADLLEELTNARYQIYFVDEIGAGFFSNPNARHEVWYELVDHIYTHQLTFIGTTNLPVLPGKSTDSKVTLEDWVGVRAYDRMLSLVGGRTGFYVPGTVNKRPSVLNENEARHRTL